MTGLTLQTACLCLASGAVLGLLFLGCKLIRGLLYGGRLMAAVLDVLFCLTWALTAFLCALVVDKGRLRMFQAALQVLGAWGAVVALDPFVNGATKLVRRFGRRLRGWLYRPILFIGRRWRAKGADMRAKRAQKRKVAKKRKKPVGARGNKPRYREGPAKSKRYAPKKKKSKNPLEKLT